MDERSCFFGEIGRLEQLEHDRVKPHSTAPRALPHARFAPGCTETVAVHDSIALGAWESVGQRHAASLYFRALARKQHPPKSTTIPVLERESSDRFCGVSTALALAKTLVAFLGLGATRRRPY
jgi:hypothetical protein